MFIVNRRADADDTTRSTLWTRLVMVVALIASTIGAILVGLVVAAAPASAVTCTGDMWTNTSGGSWDLGTNWSMGAPPTGSTVGCITAAGSYTVVIGNETINAGPLTVGGAGSTPTLTIGNTGSGLANVTFASITSAGSVEPQSEATLTVTGEFFNTGTFEVPLTTLPGAILNIASLDNQGQFVVNDTSTYKLPTSTATLLNDSTGTLNVASGETLSVSSPAGQTGTVIQDGVINDSGALTIQDAVTIEGGSICGGTPHVGVDGQNPATGTSLAFAPTVTTGPSCATGPTDHLFVANITGTLSGNIPAAYTVIIGDGGSSEPNITLSGAITNSGTFEPGWGGTFTDTSAFTNSGTFEVPASGFTSFFDFTTLTNKKTFAIDAIADYTLPTSASTLTNNSTGAITVAASKALSISSPASQEGTVTQDGVINNLGALTIQDALSVKGGSICANAPHLGTDGQSNTIGTGLKFASTVTAGPACGTGSANHLFIANITGTLSGNVPAGYTVVIGDGGSGFFNLTATTTTNAGTLEPGFGGTITFTGGLTNTGTFEVPSSAYNTKINLGGNLTNSGKITLNAAGTIGLPVGDSLTDTSSHAKVKLGGTSVTFDLTGSLANSSGKLQIAAGDVLAVSGTYTQGSSASYKTTLASTTSYGVLKVTGTATLAGTLSPKDASGFTPPHASTYLVLTSGGLGSTVFGTVSGAFTAQYVTSDSDVQITAN